MSVFVCVCLMYMETCALSWSCGISKVYSLKPRGSFLYKRDCCGQAEQRTYSSPARLLSLHNRALL